MVAACLLLWVVAYAGLKRTPAKQSNYLQQSTAKQCQQQDKEEGTSPTPSPPMTLPAGALSMKCDV